MFSSLESEQRETVRLTKENKALVNGIFQLQTEVLLRHHLQTVPEIQVGAGLKFRLKLSTFLCCQVTSLQKQLKEQNDRSDSLSEQLSTTETRLQDLESQSEEKTKTIDSLKQELKVFD